MLAKETAFRCLPKEVLEFPVGGLTEGHLQGLCAEGNFVSQGTLGSVWDTLGCDNGGRSGPGPEWVEARDATKQPVGHVAAPAATNIPAQDVNSNETEELPPKAHLWGCSPFS